MALDGRRMWRDGWRTVMVHAALGLACLAWGGHWNAGEAMMRDANPAQRERMVRLYKACRQESATELREAVETVRTISPSQPLQR